MTTATFTIQPVGRFQGTSSSIRRPREFTCFSYDDEHNLLPGSTESLRYYYPPVFAVPGQQSHDRPLVNLSTGFESFNKRDDGVDEHLDGLLISLQAHEEALLVHVREGEGKVEDVRVKADVVTWRGMMTKVHPFDRRV